jgi:hypothetical protein
MRRHLDCIVPQVTIPSLVKIEHFLRQWVIRAGASVALSKGFVRDLVTEIAPPSERFTNSWRPT